MNYHTSINPPNIQTNTISREMSVLLSTVIPFNTDKTILGAGHGNQVGRSVTHTDSIWGQRTYKWEQNNSQSWLMYSMNHFPFLTRGPYFFLCGGPLWGSTLVDQPPDSHTCPQNESQLSEAWVFHQPSLPPIQVGQSPPFCFTVKLQPRQ